MTSTKSTSQLEELVTKWAETKAIPAMANAPAAHSADFIDAVQGKVRYVMPKIHSIISMLVAGAKIDDEETAAMLL